MASFGNSPNPWASSYDTYKDCSQGLCSVYCPQWCYIIFPPPPPFGDFDDALGYDGGGGGGSGSSGTDFSPLIIAVIGILASAFILLSYYTIISKHCRRRRSGDENRETASHNERGREDNNDDGDDSAGQTASFQPHQEGLEEGLIKSIRVYKYRKSDGLVDGTDCAVCLSEFEESQGLRLLPKCNHAFHVPCIDRWLKSHSSCPLCRSNIAPFAAAAAAAAAEDVVLEVVQSSVSSYHSRSNEIGHVVVVVDDGVSREGVREEEERLEVPKIGPLQTDHARPIIRRSASLNCHGFCSDRLSVADILREEEDEDEDEEGDKDLVAQIQNRMQLCLEIGTSSKGGSDDDHDDDDHDHDQHCKWDRSGALGLIRSPLAMRRSISTGRFVFTRHGKGKNFALPN